jgi:hypothetical protein
MSKTPKKRTKIVNNKTPRPVWSKPLITALSQEDDINTYEALLGRINTLEKVIQVIQKVAGLAEVEI